MVWIVWYMHRVQTAATSDVRCLHAKAAGVPARSPCQEFRHRVSDAKHSTLSNQGWELGTHDTGTGCTVVAVKICYVSHGSSGHRLSLL